MNSILFVTSNEEKIRLAREQTASFDLRIEPIAIEIEEIQSDSIEDVARHKAADAFAKLGKPLVVNDHGWSIRALNGFPGAYMRYINAWFGPEDFLRLLAGKTDRHIQLTDVVCYIDEKQTKVFASTTDGELLQAPRGIGVPFQQVASLSADGKTIGEYLAAGEFPPHHASPWDQFAAWYTAGND